VLSRGLISGRYAAGSSGPGDFRSRAPRFEGEKLEKNLALVEKLKSAAQKIGAPVSQLAIAWVAAQGRTSCPFWVRAGVSS
jgi:pyridoxine 4-dehydrogenase